MKPEYDGQQKYGNWNNLNGLGFKILILWLIYSFIVAQKQCDVT
jgi:hypothetical protein